MLARLHASLDLPANASTTEFLGAVYDAAVEAFKGELSEAAKAILADSGDKDPTAPAVMGTPPPGSPRVWRGGQTAPFFWLHAPSCIPELLLRNPRADASTV